MSDTFSFSLQPYEKYHSPKGVFHVLKIVQMISNRAKRLILKIPPCFPLINDTDRERLVFHSVQYRNDWLTTSNLFHMFTQSIKFYTFHYQHRCLKNVIHQIDSKNGWLLLSASFTAKFGLVFVLTLENTFS